MYVCERLGVRRPCSGPYTIIRLDMCMSLKNELSNNTKNRLLERNWIQSSAITYILFNLYYQNTTISNVSRSNNILLILQNTL